MRNLARGYGVFKAASSLWPGFPNPSGQKRELLQKYAHMQAFTCKASSCTLPSTQKLQRHMRQLPHYTMYSVPQQARACLLSCSRGCKRLVLLQATTCKAWSSTRRLQQHTRQRLHLAAPSVPHQARAGLLSCMRVWRWSAWGLLRLLKLPMAF